MPKGVPKDGKKPPKERAPNWPIDPHVMELVVSKTVDVLKLPEVGGNPWQSRKLTETFRIVHEHLLASRDKARDPNPARHCGCPPNLTPHWLLTRLFALQALFYPLGEDSSPLTAGQMLRQVLWLLGWVILLAVSVCCRSLCL